MRVDLRWEQVPVRLSAEEAEAMDRRCAQLGLGRADLLRMALREALGLPEDDAAAMRPKPGMPS